MTTSPLTEASTASLDEYFSRKPPYDAATLNAIKAEFRRLRERWGESEAKPKAKRAKKTPNGPQKTEEDIFA